MSLTQPERTRFVNSYTRTLITAWSSEEYADRLAHDPHTALSETGIDLPTGSVVDVIRVVPDGTREGSVDMQVELYEHGLHSGRFEFRVPQVPPLDTVELTDGDLEAVHAGVVNCSCCPCCCCT